VPRPHRRTAQLIVTFALIAAALVLVVRNVTVIGAGVTAGTAVVVDGPVYFIWGLLLVFGAVSFLTFAERKVESGSSVFAAQAATVPGTQAEREAIEAGVEHTEVFPLTLFALTGMMPFPASNDLLTM